MRFLEGNARLGAENAGLGEEIARLKGLKGRPKIKPSGMEKKAGAVLRAGLETAAWVSVDDTGARLGVPGQAVGAAEQEARPRLAQIPTATASWPMQGWIAPVTRPAPAAASASSSKARMRAMTRC